MTLEEAQAVAKIVDMAHKSCDSCASELRYELQQRFPQFNFGYCGEPVSEVNHATR